MNESTPSLRAAVRLLLGVAAAALLAACGAVAPTELGPQGKPAREEPFRFTFDTTFDCGTFEVAESAELAGTFTTFFDRSGTPVRTQLHGRYFGTLTNLATGYTLTDGPDAYNVFHDIAEDTHSVRGLFYMVRDVDGRKVAIDVGKVTLSPDGVSVAGPHDIFDAEDGICTYLDR